MAETDKTTSRRPQINGRFPKPPFWLTSVFLVSACGSFLLIAVLLNSRTSFSDKPRVHFIQDMDNQVKRKTQSASDVFADGRSSRPPIAGTVRFDSVVGNDGMALGYTRAWNASKNAYDVTFEQDLPVKVDAALLNQGQKKFNTYCMPCHGFDGQGNGPINQRAQELQAKPRRQL